MNNYSRAQLEKFVAEEEKSELLAEQLAVISEMKTKKGKIKWLQVWRYIGYLIDIIKAIIELEKHKD